MHTLLYLLTEHGHVYRCLRYLMFCMAMLYTSAVYAQAAPVVLIVHNSFLSAEKMHKLAPLAHAAGVRLASVNIETAENDLAQAVSGAQLIVLDVPRPNDRAMVQQKVGAIVEDSGLPVLTIGGGKAQSTHLPSNMAASLTALYSAGGAHNFRHFFTATHHWLTAQTMMPASVIKKLPTTGFYHPEAPHLFETLLSYVQWADSHYAQLGKQLRGKAAFVTHQGAIGDMATTQLDALIVHSESVGVMPVVFWFDAQAPAGLAGLLAPDGAHHIDVLVNLTHMQHGAARSADFEALNIPALQTTRFREGTMDDWHTATSGVGARSTAVFLAVPEGWGMSDPIVLSAQDNGVDTLLPDQVDLLMGKITKLVALRHTAAADKKLALMFWNYPMGEKNLAASHMNVPRSIVSIATALADAGYQVDVPDEQTVIRQGQTMLGALYRTVTPEQLLAQNLAALYPVAQYEKWVRSLPRAHRQQIAHWGAPAQHWSVRTIQGEAYFVIARWQMGNLLVMPQMPRADVVGAHYHDTESAPDHLYLASYLYLQAQYGAHALMHLGTHGTQEWLPGKDRGLSADDYPFLTAGDLPIFYPYIQDNVGEAIQAKRRGRAVTISHQTPPFVPAGLYDQLRDLHHHIHEYMQLDEGAVKDNSRQHIVALATAAHMHADLGWTASRIAADFDGFLQTLHDHMHELARVAMPLGLHTFGHAAATEYRLSTVMQQLGAPFYTALDVDAQELFAADFTQLQDTVPYRFLARYVRDREDVTLLSPALQQWVNIAQKRLQHLTDTQENAALLNALAGGFVAPGAGGDPIRSPDIMSGRNLYAFEPDKIPAHAAYVAGGVAYAQLLTAYRSEHGGASPTKLAFSLWSSEAIRHLGVTESQVLHALGVQPVWDAGARLVRLDIIPRAQLGRARVDVVVQVTSVYRDQFDGFMRMLAEVIDRIAVLDEADNPVATHTRRIAASLHTQGVAPEEAARVARYRLFSSAPGAYGTGLPDMLMQSTKWENDSVLAQRLLNSTQYAYGAQGWGEHLPQANLFAEQLRGVQAAVMARSSNLHGVLSTDHPFEFLGGLSLAIRHLDGQAPALYVSDLRTTEGKTTGLARFLSDEMRVRYLHPQWIQSMQGEGYAGTLQVLNVTNNLFGWQVTDPGTVRDDQWQAMFDTYVHDTRELGINQWFESTNPTAQAQVLERMAEAIRKDYWHASEQTQRALVARWQQLDARDDVHVGEPQTRAFMAALAQGFGMQAGAAPQESTQQAASAPTASSGSAQDVVSAPNEKAATALTPVSVAPVPAAVETVRGQVLEQVEVPEMTHDNTPSLWSLFVMLLLMISGAVWQAWRNHQLR